MKWVLFILFVIHALIHSLGFVKSFNFFQVKELKQDISTFWGVSWIIVACLILIYAVSQLSDLKWRWFPGLLGGILSLVLIVRFWSDAKFGLILSLLILIMAVFDFLAVKFEQQIDQERTMMLLREGNGCMPTKADLPESVEKWLIQSNSVKMKGKRTVRLKQNFRIKLKPEQSDWFEGKAVQDFNLSHPGFIWVIDLSLYHVLQIKGRDLLDKGLGAMTIRLFSALSIVNESKTLEMNEGTLQRFLGEIVWFPAFATSELIKWESIDAYNAKATIDVDGISVSGVFTFSNEYQFMRFETNRFYGGESNSRRFPWIIEASDWKRLNGVTIPVKCTATWLLDEGPWTWAEIDVTDVIYTM